MENIKFIEFNEEDFDPSLSVDFTDSPTKTKPLKPKIVIPKPSPNKIYSYTLVDHFNITINRIFKDQLNKTTKDLLKSKFKQVQEAYDKVNPRPRINFLPMQYVAYKLIQHIGRSDLLDQITLTQNYTLLLSWEEIWQRICYNLDWGYIQLV